MLILLGMENLPKALKYASFISLMFHLFLLLARGEKKKSLNTCGHLGSFPIEAKLLAHTAPKRVQREI